MASYNSQHTIDTKYVLRTEAQAGKWGIPIMTNPFKKRINTQLFIFGALAYS